MLTLITWLRQCFLGFSTVKLLFFFFFCPFPLCALWTKITKNSPHLRTGDLYSISLRGECLHKLFSVPWHGRFIYSLPFIQAFIYMSMDLWIYILYFGYNAILLYIYCYANCFPKVSWELFQWALCPSDTAVLFWGLFIQLVILVCHCILALQNVLRLSCIFATAMPKSAIIPRVLVLFIRGCYQKARPGHQV